MTFREMRRIRQSLSREDCLRILSEGTTGVLAVLGDGGYPYTVPLNYVYADGKLYFHGAKSGHKLDAIARDDKVSFCVIGRDTPVPAEFTTYFQSVVAFGRAAAVTEDGEKRTALEALARKFSPDASEEDRTAEVENTWDRVTILRLEIEHLSGKQAKELMK